MSAKKILLLGIVLLLLIATPATVYFVQKQQELRSHAEASTTLAFSPTSTASAPLSKSVGNDFPLDVLVDPGGKNQVGSVFLKVQYDPKKLQIVNSTEAPGFIPNKEAFGTVQAGPKYEEGLVSVYLITGESITSYITVPSRVGTLNFRALEATGTAPTTVTFTTETYARSSDKTSTAGDNVLLQSNPAYVLITGGTPATPAATLTPTQAPVSNTIVLVATPIPTATPTPFIIPTEEPAPTLEATGPGDTFMTFGAVAGVITLVGAALFLAL